MSNCNLAKGCPNCKRSIENNLIWMLNNKPNEIKISERWTFHLESARKHGSPELKALIIEKRF